MFLKTTTNKVKIETPRLLIRPVELGDETQINQAINNSLEILQKWQPWANDPSIETTKAFIQKGVFAWEYGLSNELPFTVIHKADQKIIFVSGFNERTNRIKGIYEIGYWCDVAYQGHGYVTECVNALTRYAFDELKAIKVNIQMNINNYKSIAVAERLNFIRDIRIDDNYIYSTFNTLNLPKLDYAITTYENNNSYNALNWAKSRLRITDDNQFLNSKVIIKTPWSMVAEINNFSDVVYLKKTPKMFNLEPNIINYLKQNFDASVPDVIASSDEHNCFLMKSAGYNLRAILKKSFEVELLVKAVEQFANLQLAATDHVNKLLSIGIPDYRLELIPKMYSEIVMRKGILISEGLSDEEIQSLTDNIPIIDNLCKKLSSYPVKQTIVQLDFNDNNTLVSSDYQTITMIDVGELVISHPFFSLVNMLYQLNKHYKITPECNSYKTIKDACFKNFKGCFDNNKDLESALFTTYKLYPVLSLVYQDRFIKACGKESIIKFNYWQLGNLLRQCCNIN